MHDQTEAHFGTYRCPVCGHRDGAELLPDEEYRVIQCTYCETALEVWTRGSHSVRFTVQVAEEPAL